MTTSNVAAVITGDLILSEALPAAVRKALPSKLAACGRALTTDMGMAVSDLDVFRGDSWQLLVYEPRHAATACVLVRAELRAWQAELDTRAVIGIGPVESEGTGRTSTGFGEAFTLSGRGLDDLPKDRRMALHMAPESGSSPALLDAGMHLLDEIVGRWTAAQARAVVGAMRQQSQDDIGARWPAGPISQQAVAQHLRRASWSAVEHWLAAFADHIRHRSSASE